MTIIDVLAALQEGSLPTNAQLTRAIQVLLHTPALQTQLLSPAAAQLITDVRTLLETTSALVEQRNGGEEAQTFVWRSRGVVHEVTEDGLKVTVGKTKREKLERKVKGDKKERNLRAGAVKAAVVVKDDAQQGELLLRS